MLYVKGRYVIMKRNKNLEWYAFYQGLNTDRLEYVNIISKELIDDILKRIKYKNKFRKIDSYDSLKEAVKSYLMWRYMSRSEYEVVVINWSGRDMEEKIDIWYQLEPNLDRIVEYINKELNLGF